jgi:hypothetical protein
LISVRSEVQILPGPPSRDQKTGIRDQNRCLIPVPVFWKGGVAQLGERLLCKQEVIGSIPFTSTTVATRLRPRDRRCVSNAESGGVRRSEKIEIPGAGRPAAGCCLKGEERVCNVTEADTPRAEGPSDGRSRASPTGGQAECQACPEKCLHGGRHALGSCPCARRFCAAGLWG